MAKQVGQVVGGLVAIVKQRVGDRKHEAHMPAVAHRLELDVARQCGCVDQRHIDDRPRQAAIGNRGETLAHQGFQLVERLWCDHRQVHHIGIVVTLIEIDHALAQAGLSFGAVCQGFTAAHREAGGGVVGVEHLVEDVILAPAVVANAGHVLGMDDIALALQLLGIEQWREKELAETVERSRQGIGLDVEKVVGVLGGGEGVMAAPVAL